MEPDINKRNKLIKYAVIGVIVFIVVNLVLIVINTNRIYYPMKTDISYDNLTEEEIPSEYFDEIEERLHNRLASDYEGIEITDDIYGEVREGTARIIQSGNEISFWFIVDVPSLEQSYRVYFTYNKGLDEEADMTTSGGERVTNAIFFCLSNEQDIIYQNSACSENSKIQDEKDLYLYISPHEKKLPNERTATFSFAFDREVNILVSGCNDQVFDAAIEEAKKWVKTIGLNPSDYKYNTILEYDKCLIK